MKAWGQSTWALGEEGIAPKLIDRFALQDMSSSPPKPNLFLRVLTPLSCYLLLPTQIDLEIKRLLEEAHGRARALLKSNEKELKALANALLENETLNAEQIRKVIRFF